MDLPELLLKIDERMAAFRAAVVSAPDLDAPVPSCPGWTVVDLVQHLDQGRRKWAATVAAGPADAPPPTEVWAVGGPQPRDRAGLLDRLAESGKLLRDALVAAGPDQGCWTWWDRSVSPQTSGAVARHQLQEVAVHTYDAQLAQGSPEPLPADVALDGVDEFVFTCCAGDYSWPYAPASIEYVATEGRVWRVALAADGVRAVPLAAPQGADATVTATASDLVLALYARVPVSSLETSGDVGLFDRLLEWDPDAA